LKICTLTYLLASALQLYPGKRALFVCAEIVTCACYDGKDTRRYLANALFRSGGAAALLSNRPDAHRTANYRLVASTRSHGAGDTKAFE
jgi:3-ketoacyl-CoA synthase